jgi:hypothetical protein
LLYVCWVVDGEVGGKRRGEDLVDDIFKDKARISGRLTPHRPALADARTTQSFSVQAS